VADIFGRINQTFAGGFTGDSLLANLTAPGLDGTVGLLIQAIDVRYRQQTQRLYELGPEPGVVFYFTGRPAGQFSMNRVIGPIGIVAEFYATYGNPCAGGNDLDLNFGVGCNGETSLEGQGTITMSALLIEDVGIGMNAQNFMIVESTTGMFVSLTTS
jgi:hypothetical protein